MRYTVTKSWIFLGLASLAFMIAGYSLGERQGLLLGLLIALGINYLAFRYSEEHWIVFFKAKLVEGQDPWGLLELTKELSARCKIAAPKIYVIPHDFPTALSLGRSHHKGRILITQGLLDSFTKEELRAVLAHEISSIKKENTTALGIISGVSMPFLMLAKTIDSLISIITFGLLYRKYFVRNFTLAVIGLFSRIIFSKKNSLEADRTAAQMLKDPEHLAKVLIKLQSISITRKFEVPHNAADLLIVNPLTTNKEHRYFQLQPDIPSRVESLVGKYPI